MTRLWLRCAALECVVDATNAHARLAALPPPPVKARSDAASSDDDGSDDGSESHARSAQHASSEVSSILSRLGLQDEDVTSTRVPAAAA
jgi:hypothetical protein